MEIFDKRTNGSNDTKLGSIIMGGFIVMVAMVMYTMIVLEGM